MGPKKYLCLDVGERRIGVAVGDSQLRTAWALTTVIVDGTELTKLHALLNDQQITDIVVGRPRNQSGEPTDQTKLTEDFVHKALDPLKLPIYWQDESVTSVMAEERLRATGKPYKKEDIDAQAAAIILQDFLEAL